MTEQRHKYQYEVKLHSAPALVIDMVGHGKRVLELGPGPGSITRHLKANGCRVTALEIDTAAIEIVSPFCEQIHHCDLNAPQWPLLLAEAEKFSVLVAADVFEHIYDPWTVLKQACTLLAPDGCMVISLPHVAHSAVMACLLNEDFSYQSWGLLDKTHIRFWGLKNMQLLFADAGLKIIQAEFVVRSPEQTEFAHFWHQLPGASRSALSNHRFGNVYQVVIRAVPLSAGGKSLDLMQLAVPEPLSDVSGDSSAIRKTLRKFGAYLPPSLQSRIVRLLRRCRLWPAGSK